MSSVVADGEDTPGMEGPEVKGLNALEAE